MTISTIFQVPKKKLLKVSKLHTFIIIIRMYGPQKDAPLSGVTENFALNYFKLHRHSQGTVGVSF